MTKEEIKTEKRILAVLGLALLLIVMASYFTKVSAQDLSQGRIFTRSVLPSGTLPNFIQNRDILIVNGQQYYYSGGWKPVTIIRGEKGDKGDTGATGANGADGVCPTCPPASGGSGSIGFVRWVTTTAELNSAWSGYLNGSVRSIQLAADITLNQTLVVPANYNRILEIQGHGGKIIIPSSVPVGIKREYASLSEANAGIDCQLRITNVIFVGSGRTSTAIDVQATYGSEIKGCQFHDFNIGIRAAWMMGTIIDQCYAWENNIDYDLDYARFAGGSNSASQSNHTIIQNCKSRHSAGQFASIKATAVSGLRIRGCIFEGVQSGSDYEVYFDDAGSTVVKDFEISNCHIEQQQKIAAMYIKLKDGFGYVSNVFSQYDCNLVKFESTGYAKCIIKGVPYFTSGTKFENVNSAGRWKFTDIPATYDPYDATKWNGTIPYQPAIDAWQSSGQTNFLRGITIR